MTELLCNNNFAYEAALLSFYLGFCACAIVFLVFWGLCEWRARTTKQEGA